LIRSELLPTNSKFTQEDSRVMFLVVWAATAVVSLFLCLSVAMLATWLASGENLGAPGGLLLCWRCGRRTERRWAGVSRRAGWRGARFYRYLYLGRLLSP
jgi:hypothetical protein